MSAVCIMGFVGAGVAAYASGQQQASYLFMAMVVVFMAIFIYQEYRQRTAPGGGPPDPSGQWSVQVNPKGDETAATFRYPKDTLAVLRYFVAGTSLLGPAIYLMASPRPEGVGLVGLAIFEIIVVAAFYTGYRACVAYAIEVGNDSITASGLFRNRQFRFDSLGKIALLEGGGRGSKYVLALYDKKDRQLCRFGDSLEGFERLVTLVKERAFAEGTPYRYRDMWGCWTS
jgi:hypothetical protein